MATRKKEPAPKHKHQWTRIDTECAGRTCTVEGCRAFLPLTPAQKEWQNEARYRGAYFGNL